MKGHSWLNSALPETEKRVLETYLISVVGSKVGRRKNDNTDAVCHLSPTHLFGAHLIEYISLALKFEAVSSSDV